MRKAALSTVYYISNQNTTTTQNTSTPTTLTTLSSILQNEVAHIDALQSGSTSHVESAYSSTSLSLTSDSHYYTKPEPQIHAGIYIYGFCLVLIPTATILGNLLVIVSVLRFKALHSAINFLILGLAVADLLVALFVMPYAVYVYVQGGYWFLGALMCDIYSASDVSCSTASILLLAVISFDRYRAVSRPIQYSRQSQNIKRVVIIILVIWVISFAIASPIVLGVNYRPIDANPYECRFYNPLFSIFSSLLSFVIPCIIVLFVYIRIMMALREREKAARIRRFASQQIESGKDRSMQEREESEEAGELVAGPVVNCMMFALPSMNKRIKRFERHKRAIEHAGSDSLNGSQENLELDEEGDEGDDEVGFDIEEDFDEEDIALPKRRNSKCRKKLKMSERCKPWKATTQIAGALSSLVAGARNTSLNTLSFPDGQVPSDLSKHKKKRFIEAESLSTENNWRIFDRQSTSINRTNKLFFPKLEKADFSSELEEDLPKLKPTIPQIIEECYVIGDEALKTRARSCSCLLPVLSPSLNYPNSNQSIAAVSSTNTLRSNMKDKKYIIGLNAFNYYLPTASSHSEIYHIFSLSCPYLFECACFHNSLTSSDPFFKNNNQPLHNQPYYYYATNEANWLKPNKAKQNLQYSYSAPASLNEEPKLIFSNFKPNKVPTYSFELTKYDQMSDKRQPNSAPTSNRSFKKRQESNKQAKQKFFGFGLSDEVNQEHVSENGFKNINSFVGSQEESLGWTFFKTLLI